MDRKIRWITETALMLAVLVALQALTKPMGQLITGSCVNMVLAVTALLAGLYSAIAVALISPVLAYLFGIAPQILTVPAIMAGNMVFVVLLYCLMGKDRTGLVRRAIAWLSAAVGKFAVLYAIVVWLICGVFAEDLLAVGVLKAPMLQALPVTFSWMQLVTALIGGAIAMLLIPLLRKAIHK